MESIAEYVDGGLQALCTRNWRCLPGETAFLTEWRPLEPPCSRRFSAEFSVYAVSCVRGVGLLCIVFRQGALDSHRHNWDRLPAELETGRGRPFYDIVWK